HLPSRPELLEYLEERLEGLKLQDNRVMFHYLDGKVDAEIYITSNNQQANGLQLRCDDLVRNNEIFRGIRVYLSSAQN
ncbi:MAG: cation-efflux pump, partial [Gallionella sp.]